MNLHGATIIDFTGSVDGALNLSSVDQSIVSLLRGESKFKTLVVIDRGVLMPFNEPYVIADHINLTGSNPLIGPNDPVGARFPVVNDVYVTSLPPECNSVLPEGIVGGLSPGVTPSEPEITRACELGVDFFSYNIVPIMLVAAHAGWKVLGLAVPEGVKLPDDLVRALQGALSKETV